MAKIWTEEHEEFIRQNFRHKTYAELAEHFGVTQKAMESKIRRMGLKKQDYKEPDPMPAMMPQPPEPESPPVETGPTPIRSAGLLPRRSVAPGETAEQRGERLVGTRAAAEEQKAVRAEWMQDAGQKKILKSFELGLKKYHDGSLGKALEEFTKVIDGSTGMPLLGARARQYLVAIERQGRSRGFSPQSADEHYLLGVLRMNDGDPSGALEAFAEALQQAPGDDRILYCQASALAQRGDIDAALETLREAVDTNDSNRVYALNDPDFVSLRVHSDFRSIVQGDDA